MFNQKDPSEHGPTGRLHLPSGRVRLYGTAAVSTAAAAVLALGLLNGLPAGADQLDDMKDHKAQLEQRIDQVQENLAHLDADIVETLAQLKEHKEKLPGAKKRLAKAQASVAEAAREVEELTARVELAEQTKAKINEKLKLDKAEMAKTEQLIGQIATAAYKNGGMPSNLSLFFSSEGGNLADSIGMAGQALRSQNAVLDRLSQQHATRVNTRARLADVEAEIKSLKKKAEAALVREKDARDKAAAEKEKVDKLIAQTSELSEQLKAKKPKVKAKLSRIEKERQQVQDDIAEKQRQQRLAWERKQERLRKQAEARRQAQAEAQSRPAPAQAPPSSSDSGFGLRLPVGSGISMTSGFGWRKTPAGTIDFMGRGGYMHTGLDFGTPCGVPVYAPADGKVWYADSAIPSGGNRVVLTHGVVNGDALSTIYYHLQRSVVSPGQRVSKGELIAYAGNTGNSTGCHLHFETVLNGDAVNPLSVL
ncbi:M23 family metallopeptidase [Arthrobacter castelli]|uniref:M23 family metallopeptidase n=1 Tax=Arthrobacter castelli TaxID=271431 RepID=UPI00041D6D72|nr:M23 family metallopeptidase [Arthrobacter castelli]